MEKLYGKQLEIMATKARLLGLDAVHTAASGHIGGSLSAMDILTTLYFNVMQVDPANPQDPDRDRFVLSKGHCTPALYPVLSLRGFFPQEAITPAIPTCVTSRASTCPPAPWARASPLP